MIIREMSQSQYLGEGCEEIVNIIPIQLYEDIVKEMLASTSERYTRTRGYENIVQGTLPLAILPRKSGMAFSAVSNNCAAIIAPRV